MARPAAELPRIIVEKAALGDEAFSLGEDIVLIGRGRDCHLRLQGDTVSRFHARVEKAPTGGFTITDLGSSNGTWVNETRISEPTPLADGDRIRFGTVEARVVLPPVPAAGAPPHRLLLRVLLSVFCLAALVVGGFLVRDAFPDEEKTSEEREAPLPRPPSATGEVERARPETGPPTTRPAPPISEEAPGAKPPAPPRDEIRLRDGRVIRGRILERTPARMVVATAPRSPPLRIPLEEVTAVNGRESIFDAAAAFPLLLQEAADDAALQRLLKWCARHGLKEEARRVAARILEHDPMNREANALLGRMRYLGSWRKTSELRSLGALDREGRLAGTDEDVRLLKRMAFVILGRPLLEEEFRSFIEIPRVKVLERLVESEEGWLRWCVGEAQAVLPPEALPREASWLEDLAARLSSGEADITTFFRELASPPRLAPLERPALVPTIVRALLGGEAGHDRRLLESAAAMWRGKRVAVFGERGSDPEDLVLILLRQPDFFRTRIENLQRLYLGDEAPAVTGGEALRLAMNPTSFRDLRRRCIEKAVTVERLSSPRARRPFEAAGGFFVDGLRRRPSLAERLEAAALLHRAGDIELGLGILADALPAAQPEERTAGDPTDARIHAVWRSVLGRSPSDAEVGLARDLLAEADGDMGSLRAVLASSAEALWY